MSYTFSITSKGQITLPKEFRERLGLDTFGKATVSMNKKGEIIVTAPRSLAEVRESLRHPTFADKPSQVEKLVGNHLAKKYGVR